MGKQLLLSTILLLFIAIVDAQEVSKTIQRADKAYQEDNYKKALELYLKATSEGVVTSYLAEQIGNCYRLQDDMTQAEIWYENATKQPDRTAIDYLLLGYVQKANGKDDLSVASLNKLYTSQKLPDLNTNATDANSFVGRLRNGFLNFRLVPVNINSPEAEFSPTIWHDAIVFTTSRFDRELSHYKLINPQQHLNIYSAKLSNSGELGIPFIFSKDLLNQLYTGPIAFSPSGDTAYFVQKRFTNVKLGDEKLMAGNNLKIHRAIYNLGNWIDQGPLSFCSDAFSVGDPAVSPDGKKLYFKSDVPGGMGGVDLYYREIRANGSFGEAVNLGSKVNTRGNEMNPYIAKDGTLFFSSDTHPGFGGFDLFVAFPTPQGFDYVTNLGYPINSTYDDLGITISSLGNFAFFSSNCPGGKGDDDIYKLEIEKITVTHTVNGQAIDEKGTPIANLTVKILEGGNLTNTLTTDIAGKFSFKIDNQNISTINLEHPDYFPSSEKLSAFGLGLKSTQITLKVTMKRDIGYILTGTILSATDGSPIANAQAIAYPPDTTKAIISITDQLGRFSSKLNKDTDYRIRLAKEGYEKKWFSLTTKNRERGEINLSALYDTKLASALKPGITGIVTNAKTSMPIPNAIITINSSVLPQVLKLATNENGLFTQSSLPEGDYTVKIEMDGYQPLFITTSVGKLPVNLNINNKLALEPGANSFSAVGLVTNKDDNAPLTGVTISLLDKTTNEKVQKRTDEFGSFDFKLEADRIYILKLEKENFFSKTMMISTQGIPVGMINLNNTNDLKMEAIVVNKAIEIPNIYYDLGKANIKPEAAQELDKVVKLLTDNPTIQIELSSHTDARGNSAQNLQLSQKRAEAAMNYIVSKGIVSLRIVAKGYGDTKIKNRCKKGVACSEDEHAENRRTEIKVIKF